MKIYSQNEVKLRVSQYGTQVSELLAKITEETEALTEYMLGGGARRVPADLAENYLRAIIDCLSMGVVAEGRLRKLANAIQSDEDLEKEAQKAPESSGPNELMEFLKGHGESLRDHSLGITTECQKMALKVAEKDPLIDPKLAHKHLQAMLETSLTSVRIAQSFSRLKASVKSRIAQNGAQKPAEAPEGI